MKAPDIFRTRSPDPDRFEDVQLLADTIAAYDRQVKLSEDSDAQARLEVLQSNPATKDIVASIFNVSFVMQHTPLTVTKSNYSWATDTLNGWI